MSGWKRSRPSRATRVCVACRRVVYARECEAVQMVLGECPPVAALACAECRRLIANNGPLRCSTIAGELVVGLVGD